MHVVLYFVAAFCLTAVAGRTRHERILGGELTTIEKYPFAAALLRTSDSVNYNHQCGGAIISYRTILSAASCFWMESNNIWRVRVGSSFANSGGTVLGVFTVMTHAEFDPVTKDFDVGLLRVEEIIFSHQIGLANIAGFNYQLQNKAAVWTVGWGSTSMDGPASEQLRDAQIQIEDFETCRDNFKVVGKTFTPHMLCAGLASTGERDVCVGDYGGPLIHNEFNIVGIASWGHGCGYVNYPGVYVRVSLLSYWIHQNA